MQNKGMTLIELIIVVAILGIITSICVPKSNVGDYQLRSKARILTNDIRMVRYLKMTEGEQYAMIIQKHHYTILNGTRTIKKVEFGDNINIWHELNRKMVEFTYNGAPSSAGSIMIQDIKTRKHYKITIVPATGRVLLT